MEETGLKRIKGNAYKHGMRRTSTYAAWHQMRARCDNPKHNRYYRYGGRGISYPREWRFFINFFEDMGEKPEGLTLDRKDNDLNYSKENCKWSTQREQSCNRSTNNKVPGVSCIMGIKWRAYFNIGYKQIHLGVFKQEWDAICTRKSWEIKFDNK